jgi:hypothetical protein
MSESTTSIMSEIISVHLHWRCFNTDRAGEPVPLEVRRGGRRTELSAFPCRCSQNVRPFVLSLTAQALGPLRRGFGRRLLPRRTP